VTVFGNSRGCWVCANLGVANFVQFITQLRKFWQQPFAYRIISVVRDSGIAEK
jgi:hypothetical protein